MWKLPWTSKMWMGTLILRGRASQSTSQEEDVPFHVEVVSAVVTFIKLPTGRQSSVRPQTSPLRLGVI